MSADFDFIHLLSYTSLSPGDHPASDSSQSSSSFWRLCICSLSAFSVLSFSKANSFSSFNLSSNFFFSKCCQNHKGASTKNPQHPLILLSEHKSFKNELHVNIFVLTTFYKCFKRQILCLIHCCINYATNLKLSKALNKCDCFGGGCSTQYIYSENLQ